MTALTAPAVECERCMHVVHTGECRGIRWRLCGRDDGVCRCSYQAPIIGDCGDDPRDYAVPGQRHTIVHRPECPQYGKLFAAHARSAS